MLATYVIKTHAGSGARPIDIPFDKVGAVTPIVGAGPDTPLAYFTKSGTGGTILVIKGVTGDIDSDISVRVVYTS